jgi:hypothetical protein
MSEAAGTPPPPPEAVPKKINPWIIAVLVIVLVCCGCFGVAGLVVGFWDPVRQAFGPSSLLPMMMVLT